MAAGINPVHPLARGLVGCWLLNEGTGRIVHDASGRHHDGNFSGSPEWSVGLAGRAIEFGGIDDWISMGDCLDLGTDDITVLAIVKYSAVSQPDEWSGNRIGAILGKGHLDGTGKGYGLAISSGNQIHWQIRSQVSSVSAISDTALNDNQWHVVIGVCDRDDPAGVRLYIDGKLQSITANATSLNGIALNGSRAFAIGSRQDEATGAWFWDFAGNVALACVWKRVLADAEILRLQQNPLAMLGPSRFIAMLAPTASAVVQSTGSIEAVAFTSAAARVARGALGTISVSGSVSGTLSTATSIALSGTTSGCSALHGTLWTIAGQAISMPTLRIGISWLREALFNGATHSAFKLATALTQGWFWTRRSGCMAVYRGTVITQVDCSRILHVAESEAREIVLPAYLSHAAGSTHCYLVRRFNGCGHQEETMTAATLVRIAWNGSLDQARPNGVFGLRSEQIDATDVRLVWCYCPLDQKTMPAHFNLYWSGTVDDMDFGNPAGNILYKGKRFHHWNGVDLRENQHAVAIRAVSKSGIENMSLAHLVCQVATSSPESAAILIAKPI